MEIRSIKPIFFIVLFSYCGNLSYGANILFFHNVATYSHRVATWTLAQALSDRGHVVTVISPFYIKEPNPNITEIVPKLMAAHVDHWLTSEFDINSRINGSIAPLISHLFSFARDICNFALSSPEVQDWLNKTHSLDLVILDNAVAECGVGIAYKYNAKHIYFSTVITHSHEQDFLGIVPESYAIPELEDAPVQVPLSLYDRVRNTITSLIWEKMHHTYMNELDHVVRTQLKMSETMPNLYDLARNASLVFYSGDPVTDFPRRHPPFFVNVAGIHCQTKVNPLPKEINTFLQDAKDGFVYISLGSFIRSSELPSEIQDVFFKTIRWFPNVKFLWKWNSELPVNIPSNLLLAQWFPQRDLLAHPMIRAFVMQSGRPSTLEGVYHAVPMIAFPVIGDQDVNANRVNNMGGNIKLELNTVTFDDMNEAISDMVYNNTKWKSQMQRLQSILRDRPNQPLDSAIWWTEYVLRHDNLDHLKAAGFYQPWYQRRLLDVWAIIFTCCLLFGIYGIVLLFTLLKVLVSLLGYFASQAQNRYASKPKVIEEIKNK